MMMRDIFVLIFRTMMQRLGMKKDVSLGFELVTDDVGNAFVSRMDLCLFALASDGRTKNRETQTALPPSRVSHFFLCSCSSLTLPKRFIDS